MKKILLLLLLFLPLACWAESKSVLVTITPYRYLVDQIAGDTIKTYVLVPPGANMHTYEPTPKQVMGISGVDLWFRMGETLESKILPSLKNYNPKVKIVDLRQGVDLLCSAGGCSHCNSGCDLHFWMSPRIMKEQAKTIARELSLLYPENRALYEKNLQTLLTTLDNLDQEIQTTLAPLQERSFFVSHPAYGYFAKDYNLTQYSVEFEGKDPTPKQLTELLKTARSLGVKTIFTQTQFQNKGAKLVADELGGSVIEFNPYNENYPEELRKMARAISNK